jgi:hypothetical protein
VARELGSERRKTVRSLSVVGASKLSGHDRVVRAAGVSVMPPGVMQSSYARQG